MKPTLFVLAAGMGSRYGGLKQLDGLGPNGETIMDYSVYDSIKAGFGKVVFVIRKDFEQETATLKNKFSGIICRNRRHEAMLASECEPDFLVFRAWADGQEKVRELTAWYSEMFLIQSALLPMEENLDFETFQTDFVILDDTKYKIFVAKK